MTRRTFLATTAGAVLATATRGADETPRWQIGCFTRPWAALGWRGALDAIAEAGYRHAGLMTAKDGKGNLVVSVEHTIEEAANVGEEVRKRGMTAISIYGGDFHAAKSVEAGIAGLKRLVDNAAACRCPTLLLGGTNAAQAEAYYKAVKECCDYAAEKKVALVVKPHGGGNATGPECRKLIEHVGHKNFRLWYDAGNIFYYSDAKLDPADDAATVDGIVTGLCVKDFVPPKDVDVTPGTGRVDFAKVLARLKTGGFTGGPLVVECVGRGEPAAVTAQARTAREFVEQLVKRLG